MARSWHSANIVLAGCFTFIFAVSLLSNILILLKLLESIQFPIISSN